MASDWIPPDIRPKPEKPLKTPPRAASVAAVWDKIDELYRDYPDNPRVAGARAAAEWTTGRCTMSPITNVHEPPEGLRLDMEGHEAAMVEMGIKSGDQQYAYGVRVWMFWFTGLEPLRGLL